MRGLRAPGHVYTTQGMEDTERLPNPGPGSQAEGARRVLVKHGRGPSWGQALRRKGERVGRMQNEI